MKLKPNSLVGTHSIGSKISSFKVLKFVSYQPGLKISPAIHWFYKLSQNWKSAFVKSFFSWHFNRQPISLSKDKRLKHQLWKLFTVASLHYQIKSLDKPWLSFYVNLDILLSLYSSIYYRIEPIREEFNFSMKTT